MALNKLITLVSVFCIVFQFSFSQNDTINQVDENGLKQGYWEKFYPGGKPMYKGYFRDGKPVGTMYRFYESGAVKAILNFEEVNPLTSIIFYYEDGTKAAEGFYLGNEKDSVWNYYSYYDKVLKLRENYKKGKLEGKKYVYYTTGEIFDETTWGQGKKQGPWKKYFKDGTIQLDTQYENDVLQGSFKVYNENGKPELIGNHVKNNRHGKWLFFNDKGEKLLELNYNMGQLLNKEELSRKEKQYFDNLEENIGKIKEPELEDFVGH